MALNPSNPMLLTQIGRGALIQELQEKFEKAQKESFLEGVPAKLTLEVAIHAPEQGDIVGAIGWQIGASYGKKKHKAVSTLVNNVGLIYADGAGDPRQVGMFETEYDKDTGEVLSPNQSPITFEPRRGVANG